MKNYLSIWVIVAFCSCSTAQDPPIKPAYKMVVPGDESLIPGRISPHRVRYKKSGGFMTYTMRELEKDGREAYELAVYFNQDESGTPDLMYFDKQTLGYIGRRLEMKDYIIDVNFSGGRFFGELIPKEGSKYTPVKYDKEYVHNAFEPAVINYFIAALPLEEGYKASIPVFDLNKGSQMYWSNIVVLGKETVKIRGKKFEAWKVRSSGIKEKTLWIATEVPYALKMKTKGSFGTWEVVAD